LIIKLLYRADAVLEENVPEEAGDVESTEGTSAAPQSNSESSGFDSDNSPTDTPAEGAARDGEGETSSTGETGSDSFAKTDDELLSGASDEQEAAVRKNLEM
jgi:hypothetical protein